MNTDSKTLSIFPALERVDWDALYAEMLPKIYNYFRYRVGTDMLAEDLTSITFEKAWRARKRYNRRKAAFTTWLYTIARNTATDYFRSAIDDVEIEEIDDLHTDCDLIEDTVIKRQKWEHLLALLYQYPQRERDLISLKYGSGLNNRQIARIMELSESNVGTILHRITGRLRKAMESSYE